jgi:hypothetical protein
MGDQDATNAIKLQHMFERLDKLAMCIRGKLAYDSYRDPEKPVALGITWYNYQGSEAYAKKKVTEERVRQIRCGEGVLKKTVVKIIAKAPGSTIASLYKFDSSKVTAVRKAAKEEWQVIYDAWMKRQEQKTAQSNVMTGSVDDLVNRIKDSVSVGLTPIADLPMILEQFEVTQGGTEGFVANF